MLAVLRQGCCGLPCVTESGCFGVWPAGHAIAGGTKRRLTSAGARLEVGTWFSASTTLPAGSLRFAAGVMSTSTHRCSDQLSCGFSATVLYVRHARRMLDPMHAVQAVPLNFIQGAWRQFCGLGVLLASHPVEVRCCCGRIQAESTLAHVHCMCWHRTWLWYRHGQAHTCTSTDADWHLYDACSRWSCTQWRITAML